MKINNNQGIALLFVITAITLLAIILVDFSFETQINKLRTYNAQDKLQARLNAEAGLNLALTRLELYQKARNFVEEKNSNSFVNNLNSINSIWNIPFIYPIPKELQPNLEMKAAIEKFMKNSLLEGELVTEIKNVSNLINLNLLRINRPQFNYTQEDEDQENGDDYSDHNDRYQIISNLEARLVELFRQKFDKKLEEDDEFFRKYNGIEPEKLIKEIKFFINDQDTQFEPETEEIRSIYRSEDIYAKHAPLESLSELYLLDGWDDELIDMIKNEVTVHGIFAIDLNKITKHGLKLLIPEISDEEVEDFFEYRDDPLKPNYFFDIEGFIQYIASVAKILTEREIEERIDEFTKSNIYFGVLGSLFEVTSTGRYGRAEYTLRAFIEIPAKPLPLKLETKGEINTPREINQGASSPSSTSQKTEKINPEEYKEPPLKFLPPRVVEITIY